MPPLRCPVQIYSRLQICLQTQINQGAKLEAGASIVAQLWPYSINIQQALLSQWTNLRSCDMDAGPLYSRRKDIPQMFVLVFHEAMNCFIECFLTTVPVQLPNKADSGLEYTICSYHLYHNPNYIFLA